MKLIPVGVDIAKNVMQVHFVNTDTGEIFNKALKRDKFLEFSLTVLPALLVWRRVGALITGQGNSCASVIRAN